MKKKELKNEAEKNEAINVNFRNERKIWEFLKKEEEKMSKNCSKNEIKMWINAQMNQWIND